MRIVVLVIVLLLIVVVGYYSLSGTAVKLETNETTRDQPVFDFRGEADDEGVPLPWQLKASTGKARLAVRSHSAGGEERVLWVKAEGASFLLARTDREFDPSEYPILSWSWKAVTLPLGGDVRVSSLNPFGENKNDQVLQLLVTFADGKV